MSLPYVPNWDPTLYLITTDGNAYRVDEHALVQHWAKTRHARHWLTHLKRYGYVEYKADGGSNVRIEVAPDDMPTRDDYGR